MIEMVYARARIDFIQEKKNFIEGKVYIGYKTNNDYILFAKGHSVVFDASTYSFRRPEPRISDRFDIVGRFYVRNKMERREAISLYDEENKNETIVSIDEGIQDGNKLEGYFIHTTEQTISIRLTGTPSLERKSEYSFGSAVLADFVGAVILDIKLGERVKDREFFKERGKSEHDIIYNECLNRKVEYGDNVGFLLDIFTDKGLLQFVAYTDSTGIKEGMTGIETEEVTVHTRSNQLSGVSSLIYRG